MEHSNNTKKEKSNLIEKIEAELYPKKSKEEIKERILKLIEEGNTIISACQGARISRTTFYRWCKEDPEFRERVEIADRSNVFLVEHYLMNLIRQHNPTAIIFYLKTKGAWRGWKDKSSENQQG